MCTHAKVQRIPIQQTKNLSHFVSISPKFIRSNSCFLFSFVCFPPLFLVLCPFHSYSHFYHIISFTGLQLMLLLLLLLFLVVVWNLMLLSFDQINHNFTIWKRQTVCGWWVKLFIKCSFSIRKEKKIECVSYFGLWTSSLLHIIWTLIGKSFFFNISPVIIHHLLLFFYFDSYTPIYWKGWKKNRHLHTYISK